jgi:hypothetical protein
MRPTSSRSNPSFVPSASIELTSSSPAPRSIASRAQSRASRFVAVRPPWVVTTKPERVPGALDIEREHEHLRTEPVGDLAHQVGTGDGRRVDADLVGARRRAVGRRRRHCALPADGQRDEDLLGGAAHDVVGRRAVVHRRGHVEEGQLVGALSEIEGGEFDGITHVAEVLEVHALDDAAGGHVEAGDDPSCERHVRASRCGSAVTRIARAPIA